MSKNTSQHYLYPTWRWFGPSDGVSLSEIKQAGAKGIVTALHHIPCGEVWSVEEIRQRQQTLEAAGFNWTVVESVNIHESIKIGASDRDQYIEKYQQTLRNLAKCNSRLVCYNFMPVLDWTRTQLAYPVEDGSTALRYDPTALAAFELFVLKRKGAEDQYSEQQQVAAEKYFLAMTEAEKEELQQTVLAGLPGTDEVFTPDEFNKFLERYEKVDTQQLRENLVYFLQQITPVAEEVSIKMAIHPDDPPFPILGLPRVVSTENDLQFITSQVPSPSNGITFCTGSLGGRTDNDLPGMIERLGDKIHFLHLRNVQHNADGSFHEANHLEGSTDMFAVMQAVINEQQKRVNNGRKDIAIPVRPDHGHQFQFDAERSFYPGYSGVGRLRGLAELRGLELGIRRMMQISNI
ncbi:mannonate dehydratase [Tunicatimonas pelagia]|uniref:mannonate dehydratase n=1 Tax=Tunicatimonas pelagia TaxID=931531 RepID=UPI002664FC0B|nr:mannonate dehydratase [Tunicatimonas pelagia]WKN42591.1 mannonate dehydratase [Tunicatimonas pelagia]